MVAFQNSANALFQGYLETGFVFGKNGAVETGPLSKANEFLFHFQVSGIKHVNRTNSNVEISVSQNDGNVIITMIV